MKRSTNIILVLLALSVQLIGLPTRLYAQNNFDIIGMPDRQGPLLEAYFKKNNIEIANLLTISGIIDLDHPEEKSKIDPANIRRFLNKNYPDKNSTGKLVLNWETRVFKDLRNYPNSDRRYKYAEGQWRAMIKIIRQERPRLKLGIYGIPFRVWGDWQIANLNPDGKFDDLLSLLDFLAPSFYTIFPDEEVSHERNIKYLTDNLKVALSYGKRLRKPVYPFVWHRVHDSHPVYGHELVQKEVLAKYVKHIANFSHNGVQVKGVMLWEEGDVSARYKDFKSLRNHLRGIVKNIDTYDRQMVRYAAAILKAVNEDAPAEEEEDKDEKEEVADEISSLILVNADTKKRIRTLTNGTKLNLDALPTTNLSIEANADLKEAGSVVFQLTGTQTWSKSENSEPYSLFGGSADGYNAWTPEPGDYKLKVTPYSSANGEGEAGQSLTINFTVENKSDAGKLITSFDLINADTDRRIKTITSGSTINLADLPTRHINIEAITDSDDLSKIVFELTGAESKNKVERTAPYALFSDQDGEFHAWTPDLGTYRLEATPYIDGENSGSPATTITFSVIDGDANNANTAATLANQQMSVYPNPATTNLNVKVGAVGEGVTVVKLYNLFGDLVHTQQVNVSGGNLETSINVSNLPPGRYALMITSPKKQFTRRHIVVN